MIPYSTYHSRSRLKFVMMLLTLFIIAINSSGQKVPQGLNYQGVARDDNGYPIVDKEIVIQVTVNKTTATGEVVWQETHKLTTNEFGAFSIVIGEGNSTFAGTATTFSNIDWSMADYFVRIQVDFGDAKFGNGLQDFGSIKLESVPYALVADSVIHAPKSKLSDLLDVNVKGIANGQVLAWTGVNWTPTNIMNGNFVKQDGTTDLTGPWTISNQNITLTNGALYAKSLRAGTFRLDKGTNIDEISTDTLMGAITGFSDTRLPSQKAISIYVKNMTQGYWTLNGNYLTSVNKRIGIGTTTPIDLFHAELGTNGFLVTGSYDGLSIPNLGKGTRMVFYPRKAAFRAGSVYNVADCWNDPNVGAYSSAFGMDCKASGIYSVSMGLNNSAVGAKSFSAGNSNASNGPGSISLGQNNVSNGLSSTTFGDSNNSSGSYSTSGGNLCQAAGDYTFSIGYKNQSGGPYSATIGNQNVTSSSAIASLAFGNLTKTYGNYGICLGSNITSWSIGEIVLGQFADDYNYVYNNLIGPNFPTQWNLTDRLFVIGNGLSSSQLSNAMVILKNGNVSLGGTNPANRLEVSGNIVATGTLTSNGIINSSDIRLKTNIVTLNNCLSDIQKLQGVSYNWRKDEFPKRNFSDKKQLGLIAQEVEKIFPELVGTDGDGFKTVNYQSLIPVLIEAIKQQQSMITELKQKNDTDKAKIDKLTNQFDRLAKRISDLEELTKTSNK